MTIASAQARLLNFFGTGIARDFCFSVFVATILLY